MKDKDTHLLSEAYIKMYKEDTQSGIQLILDELMDNSNAEDASYGDSNIKTVVFETSCSLETLSRFSDPNKILTAHLNNKELLSMLTEHAGLSLTDDSGEPVELELVDFDSNISGDKVLIKGQIKVQYYYYKPSERDWDSEAKNRREGY